MNGMGGLFELVLGMSILLAWGFVELRMKRLDRQKTEAAKTSVDEEPKA